MWSSYEMRRCCAGLFPGSLNLFSDVSSLPFGDAVEALDELVARNLVEHDPGHRIIRFLTLPSRASRPTNGSALVAWWKGFEILPPCLARDRHVSMVRWLCEPFTKDHDRVWATTFGTIKDVDVSSSTSDRVSQVFDPPSNQTKLWENNHSGQGVAQGVRHPVAHPTLTLTFTSNLDLQREHERGISTDPVDIGDHGDLAVGTNVGIAPVAVTAENMLRALSEQSGGRFSSDLVDNRILEQLRETADQCTLKGVTLADLRLAGRFLRAGGLAYRKDLGASWASRPGSVLDLVAFAQRWQRGELVLDEDAGPQEPRPASAFTTGLRVL
jgi:hypothetical protein